jgi:hypothetical protein
MFEGEMSLWRIFFLWTRAIVIINDIASLERLVRNALIFSTTYMGWSGCRVIYSYSSLGFTRELVLQKLLTNPPFHHNVYASIVTELMAQNLINPWCSIGHAIASFSLSSRLSTSFTALDIFPAKSTMVEILATLDMRTFRISPYPPLFPKP